MARKLKITVTTASNLVVVQDYDSTSLEIYNIKSGGMGEYTMEQSGNVDLTNAAAAITFVHRDGARFGAAKITDIESVTINGVAATITNLSLVRDAVAPYFFNSGGRGFTYMKEILLTSVELAAIGDGIELLPGVAGHYYKWEVDFEFKYVAPTYNLSGNALVLKVGTAVVVGVNGSGIVFTQDRVTEGIRPESQTSNYRVPTLVGFGLVLDTSSGAHATGGNGTLLVRVWYNLIQFRP